MTKGQKIKYIGSGDNYGKLGEFDHYTNKAKTRCRFFLKLERGEVGFTDFAENLKAVK